MGWATMYIERLKKGETVQFRPRGNSMSGKIDSGDLCTVVPAKKEELEVGDIVLCKVGGTSEKITSSLPHGGKRMTKASHLQQIFESDLRGRKGKPKIVKQFTLIRVITYL